MPRETQAPRPRTVQDRGLFGLRVVSGCPSFVAVLSGLCPAAASLAGGPKMGPVPLSGPQWVRRKLGSKSEGESPRCCRCSARPWMGPLPPKEPHGGRENSPANGGGLAKYSPASPVGLRCPSAPHAPRSRSGARSGPSQAHPPTNYHPNPLRPFLAHPGASLASLPGAQEPCCAPRWRWRWASRC